ncbi:MAG: UDP-N-acetylmuramoyl-tripeptide--D-alanyl-D-alanine ligase [Hyphomonadaceae bacterium]|nr:UDP-N-acetylmuramoyl-tripeptide--D-alanyl-D-alanine ligase [Hyphomonadaceae bacterium]
MSDPLWTSEDIEAATGGQASAPFAVSGLSIDTRTLKPGDLFVALKDARDGHDFTTRAFEAGATGALVSRVADGRGPFLQVDDVLPAVEAMAVAARARSGAIRTAVTGSVGKTSVKEMLARIFRAAGPAHWPEKSFNNHWGVPLTLARMPAETQRAVFEIGMSTPGEIAPRSKLVRPHHALITKIAPAHLEGLGSVEGVAEEKAGIFVGLEAGGTVIVPEDDPFRDLLAERGRAACPTATVESFGVGEDATARLVEATSDGVASRFVVNVAGQRAVVSLNAVGEHWGVNAAAALLVATLTGISVVDAAEALSGFGPPPGRGTAETLALPGGGTFTLVDDAYNANPESMRAALSALAVRPAGRRLVALGEMLEIGGGSAAAHAGLAEPILASEAKIAFLSGAGMAPLNEALNGRIETRFEAGADGLFEMVKKVLTNGDILLIKGSNASGMGKLADALREWAAVESVMETGAQTERDGRG